jgi:hypothetical protein
VIAKEFLELVHFNALPNSADLRLKTNLETLESAAGPIPVAFRHHLKLIARRTGTGAAEQTDYARLA